ncbi:vWA domain-containing protein [Actinomadura miaoliensis]|uniref:VWA domain-containing protein n=1 Tax=Actinomadura miaoliensis TaxID=430685 RepID=A0ABP7WTM9_9ACTN
MADPVVARPVAPPPRPLPVLILADVSGSMAEGGKIDVLNRSIATMIRSFAAEDTLRGEIVVGVVTFGGVQASLHQPLAPATEVVWQDMRPYGRTPLGQAFDLVDRLLADESVVPRRAFTPSLVLVSDGLPTDEWREPLERLLASPRGGKAARLAVGVGQDMDEDAFDVLRAFIHNPAIPPFRADEAHQLSRYFSWVTLSVTTRARSARPNDVSMSMDELDDLLG